MKHLAARELLEILNGGTPSAHLEKCGGCLSRLGALKHLQSVISGEAFLSPKRSSGCLDTDEIAEYLERDSTDAPKEWGHLKDCDRCFEKAAYYFSEAASMSEAVIEPVPAAYRTAAYELVPERKRKRRRGGAAWFERFFFPSLPAVAGALMLWLSLSLGSGVSGLSVEGGNGRNFSIFSAPSDTMPYYYFGNTGERMGEALANMRITISGEKILFSWAPVKGAEAYYFALQDMKREVPLIIAQINTPVPFVSLDSRYFTAGGKYRWITAGALPQKRYFSGNMDFSVR